ncbi:MAG: MaoC family dehydratase N-terminal domain-containing protein [Proteobacteria bacterium]|nr:MaoC family dehydratase N-terminal domain-containing protein [Pseudomonadota bacterium]
MTPEEQAFEQWIGRTESSCDVLTLAPMVAMAATLDKAASEIAPGDALPPLWHWLYFLEPARQSKLASDGHAQRGDFLPPIPLPRRMWAGSRLQFHKSLRAGAHITRQSTIKSISFKEGRSGKLAFVCVRHEISDEQGAAISEEHDIVYRDHAAPDAPPPVPVAAPAKFDYSRTIVPDPVLLFRYSALTFNGHRIHYDREYVTIVEGYPGLIVHGPLLATLLVDLLIESFPDRTLQTFEFKALAPVFDHGPFNVRGLDPDQNNSAELWIQNHLGDLCMKATATIAKQ